MELDSLSMVADNVLKFVQYSPEAREISVGMLGNPELANSFGGITVAIMALFGIFFLPIIMIILIVWFITRANMMRNRLQADLYAKAIEKGVELPQSFFTREKKKRNPLNPGIICVAIGLGISLFFVTLELFGNKGAANGAAIGIIPFFIGIAYLLIWFMNKKQNAKEDVE